MSGLFHVWSTTLPAPPTAPNPFDQFGPDRPSIPVDHEAAQAATKAFPQHGQPTDDQLLSAPGPSTLPPPPEPGTLTSAGSIPPLPPGATLDKLPSGYTLDRPQQPGGKFSDDQLLAAPGPDPRQLPAGYTLDRLPPPPEPGTLTSPGQRRNPFDQFNGQPARLPDGAVLDDNHPNSAGHWAGAITRGALDGLTGLADLTTTPLVRGVNDLTRAAGYTPSAGMIALGRSGDGQLNTDLDENHYNVPMADTAGQRIAGGIAGAVAPTVATMGLGEGLGAVAGAGRAAQAVRGVGQLLSGSKGLQIAGAATGGAANVAGQEAGLSPEDAALLGLGASFIPGAGMTARSVAGNAARGAFVNSIARTLTPEEAAQTVRAGTALDSYGAGGINSPAARAAYTSDLNSTIGQYRRAATAAGYVDPEDGRAIGQAAAMANGGAASPGAATAGVRALDLPGYHGDALEGSLGQLQAVSALPSGGGAVGPMSSLVAKAAPVVAGLSALGAAHGGDYYGAAELAGGAISGATIASPLLRLAGTVGDKMLGTSMTPAEARFAAAQRVASRAGMDTSGNPLGDLQSAVSDARGDVQDATINAQNDADQAALYAQADQAWKQHAAQQADVNGTWQKAIAQRDRQNASGQPDTLSAALWRDAEQSSSPNLAAVTTSQARGFQADQAGLAQRDAQDAAAQAATEARGRNLSDQAGAWLERQQMQAAKATNAGVPITGAAALTARDPQALFEATAGRYGSPADPDQQFLMKTAQRQIGSGPSPGGAAAAEAPAGRPSGVATGGLPGQPVGMAQGQLGGASTSLQATPGTMPPGAMPGPFLGMLPSGGGALAQAIFRDYHPTQPLPSPAELHNAVDDLSADALITPQLADHLHAGGNAPSRHVAANIADRVATGRGLPSILDPQTQALQDAQRQFSTPNGQQQAAQATADVQAAMGGPTGAPGTPIPNGGPRGPVLNLPRYQAAVGSYQQHARMMFAVATTPAAKTAVAQIAATPAAADKQAILDVFKAENPGADASVFTPQLMKGV